MMVVDYARNVLGLPGANSTEMEPAASDPVITIMPSQRDVPDMGGTMRLGAYVAPLSPGTRVAEASGSTVVSERNRHSYDFNPRYRASFRSEEHGGGTE